MIPWTLIGKVLGVIAMIAVLVTACVSRDNELRREGRDEAKAVYDKAVETQKQATAAAEKRLRDATREQEIKDEKHKETVADMERRLRDAAAVGLRDPNAPARAAAAAASAAGRAADAAETCGVLSKELSGLLLRLLREADEVNVAYASCRQELQNDRGTK